jgi:hypothetical protein
MAKKTDNRTDRQLTPAEVVPEVLDALDAIQEERDALKERQSAQFGRFHEELGFSKAAVQAFLKRRRLSDDKRMQFDRDFSTLCSAVGEGFQPDLFDQLAIEDMRAAEEQQGRAH